jgi:putative PIN family toxin of toxin-antitoxin system
MLRYSRLMPLAQPFRIVLDTNVLRAAMWSSAGASYQLLRALPRADVTPLLSVPLYLEYQAVLTRPEHLPGGVDSPRMLGFLRRLAGFAEHRAIYFLWRPFLRDADDDMVLELAVAGRATHIITFNERDFAGVEKAFGIQVVTPGRFMASLHPKP